MTLANNTQKEFGSILKKLRKSKGLNQEELAAILGVRKTTISNYETGYSKPTTTMARQIADFFGVSLDLILPSKADYSEETSLPVGKPALAMNEDGPVSQKQTKTIPVFSAITKTFDQSAYEYSIDLPLSLVGEGEFFGLIIHDDRMDRIGLPASSVVIVRKQPFADDGDVALVSFGEEPALIGRIFLNGNTTTLIAESSNLNHRPLSFSAGDSSVAILGKVVKTIKSVL